MTETPAPPLARDARADAPAALTPAAALRFVLLFGFVSLFADMTYEGARSVTGPFMAALGASAAVVGTVSGLGELLGYGLRLGTGYLTDRTRRYWSITIAGYAINLFSVPLLALAGQWPVAALLIVLERTGRAIRKPAGDAMLSHAAALMGQGWAFGLREAMDQTGAVLGPVALAVVLAHGAGYHVAFALLIVPATLALIVLLVAQRMYPRPQDLEVKRAGPLVSEGIPRIFWLYLGAGALIAAGSIDFPLAAYHFAKTGVVLAPQIPLLYALAMGAAAISAPVVGRLYDRLGLMVVAGAALFPVAAAPLLFLGGATQAAIGAALFGVGMSFQDSTVRAALADLVPSHKRASAYGTFDAAFGVAWFAGSALMGILYGRAPFALVAFSVTAQLAAVILLVAAARSRAA